MVKNPHATPGNSGLWHKLSPSRLSQTAVMILLFGAALFLALFWHLGSYTNGFGPLEKATLTAAASAHNLIHNPVYLPHNLLTWAVQKIWPGNIFAARFVSAIFGVIFVYCFYYVAKTYFGRFSAWLGTILFAFTPLFILQARNSSALISLLMPLGLAAAYFWFLRDKNPSAIKLLLLAVLAAICLYQPGGILLFLAAVIGGRHVIAEFSRRYGHKVSLLFILVFLICLAPLGYGLFQTPHLLKPLLLIPHNTPKILDFLKSVVWSGLAVVWRSGPTSNFQIGRLPMLNAAQIIILFFGAVAMWSRARQKVYALAGLVIFAILATALNSDFSFLILALPALALLMCAGIRFLHLEWTSIFPVNPLPRGLAIILMVLVAAFSAYFGLRYTLDAWPHTAATKAIFVLK